MFKKEDGKVNWDRVITVVTFILGMSGLTISGALVKYRDQQRQEDIEFIQGVFVNTKTGQPTDFTNKYMVNPIVNKSKKNIEEAFRDTAKSKILAAAMHLDVKQLQRNNEKAMTIFRGLDSLGLTPQDVVNKYAESLKVTEGDPCLTIKGLYTMNTCQGIYTHRYTPDMGWRELYFSIPPGMTGKICDEVYWYNDRQGRPIIDRSISHVVICN